MTIGEWGRGRLGFAFTRTRTVRGLAFLVSVLASFYARTRDREAMLTVMQHQARA